MKRSPMLSGLAAIALASCASQPPVDHTPLAVAVTSPVSYANDGLDAVAWTQTSVEHAAIFRQAYANARRQLDAALTQADIDALVPAERDGSYANLPPAVILDIDETVLDNSPYQVRLLRSGREYDDATWADWVREEAARALPGALAFTRYAASRGVAVFYISNRDQSLDEATLANLRALGFPVANAESFLGLGTEVAGCQQVGHGKSCRRQWVGRSHRVLLQVGDQLGDFLPVNDNSLSGRAAAAEPWMDWFGTRWFMLPNPTYGSWKPALFDNDWSRSRADRHHAEAQALRAQ